AEVGSWKDFMGPLMYLQDQNLQTLSIGMEVFRSVNAQDVPFSLLMAASFLVVLPLVILFFLFQRYFVSGISLGGFKCSIDALCSRPWAPVPPSPSPAARSPAARTAPPDPTATRTWCGCGASGPPTPTSRPRWSRRSPPRTPTSPSRSPRCPPTG